MKICLLFFILLLSNSLIFSENIAEDSTFYYNLTKDIDEQDLSKYLTTKNYILNDSLSKNKQIYFSEYLVDLDRFWFLDDLENSPCLKEKIVSLTKNKFTWFNDYYSGKLHILWGEQNLKAKSIVFFSRIEKNTLRADLFLSKNNSDYFKHDQLAVTPIDKVFAYLFVFDDAGKIIQVLCKEIIYGI